MSTHDDILFQNGDCQTDIMSQDREEGSSDADGGEKDEGEGAVSEKSEAKIRESSR